MDNRRRAESSSTDEKESKHRKVPRTTDQSAPSDPFATFTANSALKVLSNSVLVSVQNSWTTYDASGSPHIVVQYLTMYTQPQGGTTGYLPVGGALPAAITYDQALSTSSSSKPTSSTSSTSASTSSATTGSSSSQTTTSSATSSATSTTSSTSSTTSKNFQTFKADVVIASASANQTALYHGWITCAPATAKTQEPTCTATSAPKGKSIAGPAAAAGVLGALFLLTLGALIFMSRRKKREPKSNKDMAMGAISTYTSKSHETRIQELESELADRNEKLTAVQGDLLKNNHVQALDDRAVQSRFEYIAQELKDWAISHFPGTVTRVDLPPKLRQTLATRIRNIDGLVQQRRTKSMVIRAIAAYFLQQAFEDGEFVAAGSMRSLGRLLQNGASAEDFNRWRSNTFTMLERGSSQHDRAAAVDVVTKRIETALGSLGQTASRERYQYLRGIVESVSNLAWDLGKQTARFKWVDEVVETAFRSVMMDDVWQEHETFQDSLGNSSNPLDGKSIQAIVFPAVVKYGDGLGENYDRKTVILKAKVYV